jgi:MoaA/NifB/PqqE/SkfB family radical SAM enzyme
MTDFTKKNNLNSSDFPQIIHWHICGRCQLNCDFCYAIPSGQRELNTDECKEIIKRLVKNGAKVVVFTGGEPLLRQDITDLVKFCKERGLKTALDTNGILLSSELINKFEGFLDRIGLPLDGYPMHIHDGLRGKGHFMKVYSALLLLKDSKIKIKINTVVNKINRSNIEQLGKILEHFKISLWSLYQFYPLAKGYLHKKKFMVSAREFNLLVKKITKQYPQILIEGVPYQVRKGVYFGISPAGSVYTTPLNGKSKHIILGNVFEYTLSELWNKNFICRERYNERYKVQLKLL